MKAANDANILQDALIGDKILNVNQGQVEKDSQKEWQIPNATEGWKAVIDTMVEHDNKMIKGWRDELGNLLIFVCPKHFHFHARQMSIVLTRLCLTRLVFSQQS